MASKSFHAAATEDNGKQLLRAVLRRDMKAVKQLLAEGTPPDVRNAAGHTPLIIAASLGYGEIARTLLKAKADPNAQTLDGSTALSMAGSGWVIDSLVTYGADPLAGNPKFRPGLLRLAAKFGNENVFNLLIAAGTDTSADTTGATLLMYAAEGNRPAIVEAALKICADVKQTDNVGRSAMVRACLAGSGDCIQMLLDAGADVKERSMERSLLAMVAEAGSENGVDIFLKTGAKVLPDDYRDSTSAPLRAAIRGGNLACVEKILAAGADPLNMASDEGSQKQTTDEELAVTKGGEIAAKVSDAARKFHLAEAAGAGDKAKVDELLESGVPVDTINRKGQTALVSACIAGKADTAMVLLLRGANPNVVFTDRWDGDITPLSAAMKHENSALFEALVLHGADVNGLQGENGEPVFFAVLEKPVKFVDVLLGHGADPNAVQESTGRTVIYRAISLGDISLVEHLIEGGARVDRKDNEGVTPEQLAEKIGNGAILNAIKAQYSREMDEIAQQATSLDGAMTPLKALKFRLGSP